MNLKNWTAKRAGGRITIYGVDKDTGKPVKLVGVDTITPNSPPHLGNAPSEHIIASARDMHGESHSLYAYIG